MVVSRLRLCWDAVLWRSKQSDEQAEALRGRIKIMHDVTQPVPFNVSGWDTDKRLELSSTMDLSATKLSELMDLSKGAAHEHCHSDPLSSSCKCHPQFISSTRRFAHTKYQRR